MFEGIVANARAVKQIVPNARFYVLCDWLDMVPVDTRATPVDRVLVLRGRHRAPFQLIAHFFPRRCSTCPLVSVLAGSHGRDDFTLEFVEVLLDAYLPDGGSVLHPFVGSGTVPFEAGRTSIYSSSRTPSKTGIRCRLGAARRIGEHIEPTVVRVTRPLQRARGGSQEEVSPLHRGRGVVLLVGDVPAPCDGAALIVHLLHR